MSNSSYFMNKANYLRRSFEFELCQQLQYIFRLCNHCKLELKSLLLQFFKCLFFKFLYPKFSVPAIDIASI